MAGRHLPHVQGQKTSVRYVVLATDAAPTYAVWAPVAARLWARHGYRSIFHLDSLGWESPFGRVILDELVTAEVAHFAYIPRTGELTVPNTMRCSRNVAAAAGFLEPDDFILTADVDMMPLRGAFFDKLPPFVVLRAMFATWLGSQVVPPVVDVSHIWAGNFRFPMCYAGATTTIWREMFPGIIPGDTAASLAAVLIGRSDAVDLDETLLSYAFLSSPRAAGPAVLESPAGVWRKGELVMIDPMEERLLSEYFNMPRAMLRYDDLWHPGRGTPPPPDAIDFIPNRFLGGRPWCCFDVVSAYFPDMTDWLANYRRRLETVL